MAHAASSAMALAMEIEGHPCIRVLDYPGLATHADHAVASKQFRGSFGNMLTLTLQGGLRSAQRLISLLSPDIPFCPTLGEAQTTVSHPCSTSHRSYSQAALHELGIDEGTLRFSIGLEPKEWLVGKIASGLSQIKA
jgi:cystathionine beta-lyase/cystathionine gamma-synthase